MPIRFQSEQERQEFFSRIAKLSNRKGQQSGFAANKELASRAGRIGGRKVGYRPRDERGRFIKLV